MKKNDKEKLDSILAYCVVILLVIFIITLLVVSITKFQITFESKKEDADIGSNVPDMIQISDTLSYDSATGVEYWISADGVYTVRVNSDGSPIIYSAK